MIQISGQHQETDILGYVHQERKNKLKSNFQPTFPVEMAHDDDVKFRVNL